MGTVTANYGLYKPAVKERGWGLLVDGDLDTIDGVLADFEGRVAALEAGGTGGGHVIQDDGIPLTQRSALNFLYSEVSDDLANDATVVGAPTGFWVPLSNGDPDDPGLIFADGQVVMVFMEA